MKRQLKMHAWEHLNFALNPLRNQLLDHPIYRRIRTVDGVQTFMEYHVFAVWDFMSLLKALQQRLCCVSVPWLPPANAFAARLINEIVLAEETDVGPEGAPASHFDLYLDAMRQAGADDGPVLALFERLREGKRVPEAFAGTGAPPAAQQFVEQTFEIIGTGDVASIASAFTFGREDLLPGLFAKVIEQVDSQSHGRLGRFRYYLDRHVALDGDEHGPAARRLMQQLCGDEPAAWMRAEQAAVASLKSRLALWDAMDAAV
jgi:hypothetical protein